MENRTTPGSFFPEEELELSIVMPCLNEANSLGHCIDRAQSFLAHHSVRGEVVVADNGSTDGSQTIAAERGARVVDVPRKGYGSALRAGISAARGKYIIMGDADASYDFSALQPFVDKLREGNDLVMGNRFRGGIAPRAMPFLHRYLGNPVLTAIGRLLFRTPSRDFHCGLRGFSKEAAARMDLQTTGMEFASEMVVKASLMKMKTVEVPTTLSPDLRNRPPHLRTWRDGWRHLQFVLFYSPRWLFLYPGLFLTGTGAALCLWLGRHPKWVGAVMLDVHTLLYAAASVILGFQITMFGLFGKVYAVSEGLLPGDSRGYRLITRFRIEHGILAGVLLCLAGLAGSIFAFRGWSIHHYGPLDPAVTMRSVIPSVLALVLGVQLVFSSFFLGLLRIRRSPNLL